MSEKIFPKTNRNKNIKFDLNSLTSYLGGFFLYKLLQNKIIMYNFFMMMKLRFFSFFVEKPKKKLTWTSEDFKKGMKYAKTQPHPFKKGKTLWDLCYDKTETVYTIDNLNKFLFNEI